MATVTRSELVSDTQDFMDATGSERWSAAIILTVLDSVFDGEWSNILSAAPYYRAATRTVTTDANGQFALTDLDSGTGDSAQNHYRIISITDGTYVYSETRFQDAPLATSSNYPYVYDRTFYLMGSQVQVLPVAVNTTLSVTVNYKPPVPSDLASDSSVVDYPANSHLILVWEAAARLLMKGGAETQASLDLMSLTRMERETLLLDLQRRTIAPMRMMPMDDASDWGSY